MKHLRRLPPLYVPIYFWRRFGELDAALCERVARFVDLQRRRVRVDVALIEIGDREGFGRSQGFKILRAGRWLVNYNKITRRAIPRREKRGLTAD